MWLLFVFTAFLIYVFFETGSELLTTESVSRCPQWPLQEPKPGTRSLTQVSPEVTGTCGLDSSPQAVSQDSR